MKSLRTLALLVPSLAACAVVALIAVLAHDLLRGDPPGRTVLVLLLLAHVLALGATIVRFAAVNLRGQHRQGRFAGLLALAIGALALMAASPGLLLAAVGWSLGTVAVVGLIGHAATPGARRAARAAALLLGLGDLGLWLAMLAGTGLLSAPLAQPLGALGLIVAVTARGALVPWGEWLVETAEAPSPVSALLHAGVVNGGVLLLVLHPDELPMGTVTRLVLATVAGLTVVLAVLAQQARTDVKGRLAASTSAQMALATAQVAVGLPGAAFVHVLGHAWWKARLFLVAGGAITRARGEGRPITIGRVSGVLGGGAGLLVGGAVLAACAPVRPALLLPASLVGLVTGIAVAAAAAGTVGTDRRLAAATRALLLGAAFGAVVVVIERSHLLGAPAVSGAVVVPVLAGLVLAGLLAAASSGPVALLRIRLALPGWAALPGSDAARLPVEADAVTDAVRVGLALDVVGRAHAPAWPLRTAVAVSPQAGLEHLDRQAGEELLDRLHGRDARTGLRRLLVLQDAGVISSSHLRRALADLDAEGVLPDAWRGLPVDDVVAYARASAALVSTPSPDPARDALQAQVTAWAGLAWSRVDSADDPWSLWLAAVRWRGSDRILAAPGLGVAARRLPGDPRAALAMLHGAARRRAAQRGEDQLDLMTWLVGLTAAAPGWCAHARWRVEHQGRPDAFASLCALLAVLDLLHEQPVVAPARDEAASAQAAEARRLMPVWQRAVDLVVQERLLGSVTLPSAADDGRPVVHSLWCLDARSGPMRRHLEAIAGPRRHRTHGVAGFFGVDLATVDPDGTVVSRAPGLLQPSLRMLGAAPAPSSARLLTAPSRHPLAVLGWAELGGVLAIGAGLRTGWRTLRRAPARAHGLDGLRGAGPVVDRHGCEPSASERARTVAGLLRAAGIADELDSVLVVVGHGSTTANNAYASAYDCGACGAHPGAVNAAVLTAWINDPAVRTALAAEGVTVPPRLTAVAALHDTTGDVVVLDSDHPELAGLRADLALAADRARAERTCELPGGRPATTRGADDAEPMPEWGLAGAHGLLLGRPRLSAPSARWFQLDLHDGGSEDDLAALRDALAGPGLVAAGIMSAYAAGAEEPHLLGSGDKTTHNVVGDVGVLRGRTGDLAVGLPWQALSAQDPRGDDGLTLVRHLPARPLIAVETTRDRLRAAVAQVPRLELLVAHGWVRLWALERTAAGDELVAELAGGRWIDARSGAPAPQEAAVAVGRG